MDGSSNNLVYGFRTVDLKDVCTIIQWQIVKCSSQLASNGECVTSMRTHKMTQSVTYCISTFLTCCSLNFSELACTDSKNLLTLKHCECTFFVPWNNTNTFEIEHVSDILLSMAFPIQFRLCFYTLGENAFNWENTQESSLVSPSHTFIHPNGAEISERAHFHCKIIRLKSIWIGASELDYCSIEAVYPFCIPQKLETLTMHEP